MLAIILLTHMHFTMTINFKDANIARNNEKDVKPLKF